jgi:predicted MFS family arabinose efflux permease
VNLGSAEAREELGITYEDVTEIRHSKRNPNRLLLLLLGALASIGGFVLGYFLDMENHLGYPYASLGLSVSAVPLSRKRRWLAPIVIIVAALMSFVLGAVVADPPNYGLTPKYSVYGNRQPVDS